VATTTGTKATEKAVENILGTWKLRRLCRNYAEFLPGIMALDQEKSLFWKRCKTSQVKSNKERVYQLVRDYPVFLSAEKNRGKRFVLGLDSRLFRLFNILVLTSSKTCIWLYYGSTKNV